MFRMRTFGLNCLSLNPGSHNFIGVWLSKLLNFVCLLLLFIYFFFLLLKVLHIVSSVYISFFFPHWNFCLTHIPQLKSGEFTLSILWGINEIRHVKHLRHKYLKMKYQYMLTNFLNNFALLHQQWDSFPN